MAWRNTALEQMDINGLAVSYAPAEGLQNMRIQLTCAGKPEQGIAPESMYRLVHFINHGFAGGATFTPTAGSARLLRGPQYSDPDEVTIATTYDFAIEVGGVDPLFVAAMVDILATSGYPHRVTSLSITPEGPAPAADRVINEEDVKRWLQDNTAFPGRWAEIPFEVVEQPKAKGGTVQIRLASAPATETFDGLSTLMQGWRSLLGLYPDPKLEMQGLADFEARVARKKQELTASYRVFDYHPKAASDALINALCRFHHTVAAIERVTLSLS